MYTAEQRGDKARRNLFVLLNLTSDRDIFVV